jgi:hypothetical protein
LPITPNVAKGNVAYYAGLPAANDGLIWVLLTGTETDDNLRDAVSLSAVLALAVDEATFTGYTRRTATSVTVTVDNTYDTVTADAADPSWSPTSAQALTRIALCYDPDTTTGTDADLIPLYIDSFDVTTPTSGTVAYQVPSTGFYREGDNSLVSVDDFALYLNNPDLNRTRAAFILAKTQTLCETVVKPLPPGADIVILDVAERAFANPVSIGGASPAYYAEGEGPFSDTTPGISGGGLYLTKNNKATLRRLAGSGTAFTIDMLPATEDLGILPPWDSGADTATLLDLP